MRKTVYLIITGLVIVVLVSSSLLAGKAVRAQNDSPATEPGGVPAKDLPPAYDSGDPSFDTAGILPPDENPPDGVRSPSVFFSYYQVSGASLRGRNSDTGYAYAGVGCSYVTSGTGTGRILNTELPLPDGAIIKYLRVYYRDTNAVNGVEGYLTRYQPGVGTLDLVHAGSTDAFVGGYGFVVSAEITETVNNTSYAYTLIGWPDDINVANQICGLRVAYYSPYASATFLPAVRK